MIKREFKINFKSFIIWTLILIGLFLAVFLIYPTIMSSSDAKELNEILKTFPEELVKAFNMDISSIDSAFGWLKSEGMMIILIVTGVYSGIMGSTILLKEENDKTIEYLNSLPINRNKIITSKIIVGLVYILSMIFILGLFNFTGLVLSGTFDKKVFFLLSFTPLLTSLLIYSICLFISTYLNKTKKVLGISLGIVFINYFIKIISELNDKVSNLKYLSIYSLADTRNVILNGSINPVLILISLGLSSCFILLTYINYNKKEFL